MLPLQGRVARRRNLYEVLRVDATATAAELEAAFRDLERELAFAAGNDPRANQHYREARAAFDLLRDINRRAAYDEKLATATNRDRVWWRTRREDAAPPALAFLRDIRHVLPYLRPHSTLAVTSVLLMIVAAGVSLITVWPLAILVDSVLGDKPLPSLLGPLSDIDRDTLLIVAVLGGFVVTGLQQAVGVAQNYTDTRLELGMSLAFKSDLYRHAQRLSAAFHDSRSMGQMMYGLSTMSQAVGSIAVAVPALTQSIATLVGMFVIAFVLDAGLALISLAVVPFIYRSAGYYLTRVEPRLRDVRNLEAASMQIVHEMLTMLRVIVAFGREDHEYRRFREQSETAMRARVQLTLRQTLFSLGVTMITAGGTAAVIGVGAHHVLRGSLTVGELLVVMGYIAAIYQPLTQISNTLGTLQEQFMNFSGARALLDQIPDIEEAPDAVSIGGARGDVRFENVSFAHRGRTHTLEGISLAVAAGTRVGIVGATGAGKTTLVNLIGRMYDVQEGRVLLDGVDVRRLKLASLRAQIAPVFQEPLLWTSTVYENILYGRLDATREEVEAAARAASAHDFISALPQGYETTIGDRGAKLSGGERQRISIARAFLKDAPILVLDEPTSSIDLETEREILAALESLMEGRTTFMIAHRLSTLMRVDWIVVLANGRVVEQGPYDELLAGGGAFARLHELHTPVETEDVADNKAPLLRAAEAGQ